MQWEKREMYSPNVSTMIVWGDREDWAVFACRRRHQSGVVLTSPSPGNQIVTRVHQASLVQTTRRRSLLDLVSTGVQNQFDRIVVAIQFGCLDARTSGGWSSRTKDSGHEVGLVITGSALIRAQQSQWQVGFVGRSC